VRPQIGGGGVAWLANQQPFSTGIWKLSHRYVWGRGSSEGCLIGWQWPAFQQALKAGMWRNEYRPKIEVKTSTFSAFSFVIDQDISRLYRTAGTEIASHDPRQILGPRQNLAPRWWALTATISVTKFTKSVRRVVAIFLVTPHFKKQSPPTMAPILIQNKSLSRELKFYT
jgi:hypothetical protein